MLCCSVIRDIVTQHVTTKHKLASAELELSGAGFEVFRNEEDGTFRFAPVDDVLNPVPRNDAEERRVKYQYEVAYKARRLAEKKLRRVGLGVLISN